MRRTVPEFCSRKGTTDDSSTKRVGCAARPDPAGGGGGPGRADEAKGKIKKVSPETKQFVLIDGAGKDWTIHVDPARISIAGKAAQLTDLKPGDEVDIVYTRQNDKLNATAIVRK